MTQPTTILEWLTRQYPQAKKTTLRDMVEDKRVRINGMPAKSLKQAIGGKDKVEVGDTIGGPKGLAHGLRIVYQDSDIVVVDKPVGLLTATHPKETRPTVLAILTGYYRNQSVRMPLLLVHRLDRAASGLLVFARSEAAFEKLKAIFEAHDLSRQYVAIVHGVPKKPKGTLKHLLFEDAEGVVRVTGDRHKGKEAVLHYEVLESGGGRAKVRCTLETGRKHQIRVQLKTLGHPICGDEVYGIFSAAEGNDPPFRLALHATHLAVAHPRTGKTLAFDSPAPAGWDRLLRYEEKKPEAGGQKPEVRSQKPADRPRPQGAHRPEGRSRGPGRRGIERREPGDE